MLVDTSVAVALCVGDHTHHDNVVRALRGQRIGLAGHAVFETFSALLASLPSNSISGGAIYDALVGAVAKEHQIVLGTRDTRALSTYRTLDVEFKLIGETSHH